MLALRTAEGIDKESLALHFGDPATLVLQGAAVKRYVESGHLLDDAGFLRLTDAGFLLADKIIADIVS